ncbi:hypothetical protein EV182_003522 [Spiromyces aspiralis]|uniref:Uncharacterized protein n=1 Tax=Spiromyces aspiralis TaxID=68401 RepID=A0ACC1HGT0_9FUNG|nr:hypothetical protein EV182_003522 [Spiromyces aspiralis]
MARPPLQYIRLVTFDAFHTLYMPKGSVGLQYATVLAGYGIHVDTDVVQRANKEVIKEYRKLYPNYGMKTGMTTAMWWQEVVVQKTWIKAGVPEDTVKGIIAEGAATLIDRFNSKEGYDVYPDVVRTLRILKRKGIKLGVISNSDERTKDILASLDLSQYFDFIVTSAKFGEEKPSPLIFEAALRNMGVSAFDALHVGDDYKTDYVGAKSVGMEALIIDRACMGASETEPGIYIHSMQELIPLLASP